MSLDIELLFVQVNKLAASLSDPCHDLVYRRYLWAFFDGSRTGICKLIASVLFSELSQRFRSCHVLRVCKRDAVYKSKCLGSFSPTSPWFIQGKLIRG